MRYNPFYCMSLPPSNTVIPERSCRPPSRRVSSYFPQGEVECSDFKELLVCPLSACCPWTKTASLESCLRTRVIAFFLVPPLYFINLFNEILLQQLRTLWTDVWVLRLQVTSGRMKDRKMFFIHNCQHTFMGFQHFWFTANEKATNKAARDVNIDGQKESWSVINLLQDDFLVNEVISPQSLDDSQLWALLSEGFPWRGTNYSKKR